MRRLAPLALCALIAAPPPAAASTVTVDGRAEFARTLDVEGAPLVLSGAGLFRWKYFVKVYAAAFYFGEGALRDPAADVPRRLEIEYFVAIDGPGFGRAADELLRKNLPAEELAALRERLDRLHAAYVDVKPGDRYALTYLPGRGTELALNGRPLVRVEGEDFARAYFTIWTGGQPIDRGLRDALLGRVRG
jgi:hypothetical protein